jgi:hypothetical protein
MVDFLLVEHLLDFLTDGPEVGARVRQVIDIWDSPVPLDAFWHEAVVMARAEYFLPVEGNPSLGAEIRRLPVSGHVEINSVPQFGAD